ncbi:MAG: PspC domain-containing protein [Clostridiales bacterium]|jgi:phage shock protein C|nr:PspC domain-containing protein [Clostridiales bacterium]
MGKKLYKSRTDAKLDGVCGGIAQYFGIDSTIVRIALIVFVLLGGSGILAYIICMLVMPREPVGGYSENVDDSNQTYYNN